MVQFDCTLEEINKVHEIVNRAYSLIKVIDKLSLQMDLEATHSNGNRLNFEKLLAFDDFNFLHDIEGIRRNIDRKTGKLLNLFSPKCSM